MNIKFLLFLLGSAVFASCSSAYKTGQTPDDVYYSPAREQNSYVKVEKEKDRYNNVDMRYQAYDDYVNDYRNERFLRLSLNNRMYLNMYNDYYWNDWRYGNTASLYNPWNNYYSWNSFYNPYCYNTGYNFKGGNYYRPNINVTNNNTTPKTNPRYNFKPSNYANTNYTNSNTQSRSTNRSTFGKIVSTLSTGSSNYNSNSNNSSSSDRSTRTYTPSSSSSSGSSSGSSGSSSGGSVSRPTRGGGN